MIYAEREREREREYTLNWLKANNSKSLRLFKNQEKSEKVITGAAMRPFVFVGNKLQNGLVPKAFSIFNQNSCWNMSN